MWSVMNSLNIVSRLTTSSASPPRSRTGSTTHVEGGNAEGGNGETSDAAASIDEKLAVKQETEEEEGDGHVTAIKPEAEAEAGANEKTPLLSGNAPSSSPAPPNPRAWSIPQRITQAVLRGVQVVLATITAPGRYVIACFYDQQGHFSAILPLRNLKSLLSRRRRKSTAQAVGLSSAPEASSGEEEEKKNKKKLLQRRTSSRRSASVDSNASSSSSSFSTLATSDGDLGENVAEEEKREDSPARHTRSRTAAQTSQPQPQQDPNNTTAAPHLKKKSITIHNSTDEALRKRRAAKAAAAQQQRQNQPTDPTNQDDDHLSAVANALKSPSSSLTTKPNLHTRYPRAPHPPRPLVPRRQPSYTLSYAPDAPKKTLIIDLDETLIHSMAKGGRMSTGHMVEVRLGGSGPIPMSQPGMAGPANISLLPHGHQNQNQNIGVGGGVGVPILYYVHERPNCHDFLRKVSKWYNLVVFTASVQEYADPVIDWLERERRYFLGGRYYRQHCTLRNGAYIKDLAQVEPDLSRVVILDNSPMSYIFHEDNAIPIEGWISDPTDNDLLHLIPLLEGLQYVTDVRALLALRQGQAQQA